METLSVKSGLSEKQIAAFTEIVGEQHVLRDDESLDKYAHDETEDLHYPPDVVIKPRTAEEISAILKISQNSFALASGCQIRDTQRTCQE